MLADRVPLRQSDVFPCDDKRRMPEVLPSDQFRLPWRKQRHQRFHASGERKCVLNLAAHLPKAQLRVCAGCNVLD